MDSNQRERFQNHTDRDVFRKKTGERWPNKKGAAGNQSGEGHSDNKRDRTVKSVTPDPPIPGPASTPGRSQGPSTSSASASPRGKLPHRPREHSASLSNTDEESTSDGKRMKGKGSGKLQKMPPTESSPSSFLLKTRHRFGSMTAYTQPPTKTEDAQASVRPHSAKQTIESDTTSQFTKYSEAQREELLASTMSEWRYNTFQSPALVDTDSAKILRFMKTTSGRMHGILFFRSKDTEIWASGYCAINVAPGSLVCQVRGDPTLTRTLIPDLRGCSVRTHHDEETQARYLSVVTAASGMGVHLRPPVPETFDSWLAALLCWQPLRPKGAHNKMAKPQSVMIMERKPSDQKLPSDMAKQKGSAIIKVGKMMLWQGPSNSPAPRPSSRTGANSLATDTQQAHWRRVSCTLHENGHFKLLEELDTSLIALVQLSDLSRFALQKLHPSVFGEDFCVAIYPRYTADGSSLIAPQTLFLRFDSRVAHEVWFVLLRAFAVPELYGPKMTESEDIAELSNSLASGEKLPPKMFRIEKTLSVRITDAKLKSNLRSEKVHSSSSGNTGSSNLVPVQGEFYAEVILDGDIRARTAVKPYLTSAFWVEEFSFTNIPPTQLNLSVLVKVGNVAERDWTAFARGDQTLSADEDNPISAAYNLAVSSHDAVFGRVSIDLDLLDIGQSIENRWPILDANDSQVGDLLMKVVLQETVVLLHDNYAPMSQLLHDLDNGLTNHISQALQPELKRLSDILLDIYQVSHKVTEWITNLVDEEIDGIYQESLTPRLRFSGRIQSSDSYDSGENRELLVRDLGRSAEREANLLFRGNSLLTKALDPHMRRLGQEYLEEILGVTLRAVNESSANCEVDPSRVRFPSEVDKNWTNLIGHTSALWKTISLSAERCPIELRILFHHVRSCAEDRYGSFIRTVGFTSVSGFFFLRLICPAILNPHLFGLLKDRPPEKPRRALTLIAKSLNNLSTLTRFGSKESWMEPMNRFLVASTPGYKSFVNELCNVSTSPGQGQASEPQYHTPTQILSRLPAPSREGFLSLPFLLDSAKLHADLVNLWVEHAPSNVVETGEPILQSFHSICVDLHQQAKDCLATAEQADNPNGDLDEQWEEPVDERRNTVTRDALSENQESPRTSLDDEGVTALPIAQHSLQDFGQYFTHRSSSATDPFREAAHDTPPSTSSTNAPAPRRGSDSADESNNSSSQSLGETSGILAAPGSRDGPRSASAGKGRFKDLAVGSVWHKAKNREYGAVPPRRHSHRENSY